MSLEYLPNSGRSKKTHINVCEMRVLGMEGEEKVGGGRRPQLG